MKTSLIDRNAVRELFALAWPIAVSSVSYSLMSLCDTIFVSAQCRALHVECNGHLILGAAAPLAQDFDVVVELHSIIVLYSRPKCRGN